MPPDLTVLLLSLAGILTVLAIYPMILGLLAVSGFGRLASWEPVTPSLSVVIATHNARDLIRGKIENTFSQNYPADLLQVVVCDDGSDDGTLDVLREMAADRPRLTVLSLPSWEGKTRALNWAVTETTGDILVLSDADAALEPGALQQLAGWFADPAVGGVCGQRLVRRCVRCSETRGLDRAQKSYVDFDSTIKALESRLGSLTSNDGKLYAVRRSLFPELPEAVTDDLFACLAVVRSGQRFVFDPRARARVPVPSRGPGHEIVRRRRIVTQSLRGLWIMRELLKPLRYGAYAPALAVNKIARRLLPVFVLGFFGSSLLLAGESATMSWVLAAQIAGLVLAAAHPILNAMYQDARPAGRARILYRLTSLSFYFVLGNLGTLLGMWDFALGRAPARWTPIKTDRPPSTASPTGSAPAEDDKPCPLSPAPRVAYVVSRFPKITETFVLYEMLAIMDRGRAVAVWPLLRQREITVHPEIARIMPHVVYIPFISVGVVLDALFMFASRPGRFLRILAAVLTGTVQSPDFFFKTLAIFPKACAMARRAERENIGRLHAHFATHPAMAAYIVHRLTGIPYSFTCHAHDIQMDTTMLAAKMRAADLVVTISEYNRRLLSGLAPDCESKIFVVRCGADLSVFEALDTDPDTPRGETAPLRLVCVASYKDMKGHRFLVDALKALRADNMPFVCDLVGDGPLSDEVAQRIQAVGIGDRVTMHGLLPRPEVARIMRRADAAVLASVVGDRGDHDGIPVFLMEAMALSLPVVSTTLSGIPELVQHGVSGLLVPPGNSGALADALRTLAVSPNVRRAMGEAGRKWVLAEYDLAVNATKLANLFDAARPTGESSIDGSCTRRR